MAIREQGVSVVTVGDLLGQQLRIPHYQRPYTWEPPTAVQLLDDIKDASDGDQGRSYVLGAVILHDDGEGLDVVDGQQRLLTLRMIQLLRHTEQNELIHADTPLSRVWRAICPSQANLGGRVGWFGGLPLRSMPIRANRH